MTYVIQERTVFGALLFGLTFAACSNTPLVGAEPQRTSDAGTTGAAGTSPVEIIVGTTPETGPPQAGPWLFFDSMRDGNRDIYAVLPDGTSLKRMTTSPAKEQEPSVSPDGTTLAFSSDANGSFQIYLVPLPGGTARQLTQHKGGAGQPAWSPDGTQIVFLSSVDLSIIGSDGQNDHAVLKGVELTRYDHAVFAPGGRALVLDRYNQINRLDLDNGAETPVVRSSTTSIQHPSVSPNGHLVAYNADCDSVGGNNIWIAPFAENAATTPCMGGAQVTSFGPRSTGLERDAARFPSFSPDGFMAFEHIDDETAIPANRRARIGIIDPDGPITDVTHGEGDDRNPTWSPASLVLR
jgi:Tol biopolymer transport system component